ncbi:MAG: DUF58 domain-containing protein [Sphingobacteriales bacterium]|nr:DUF58 domain-containing protein [Sphingobacteriales bacterium]
MTLLIILVSGFLLWSLATIVFKSLFLNIRFFIAGGCVVFLFILSFFFPQIETAARILFYLYMALLLADTAFLFITRTKPLAKRTIAERMSNGDPNPVSLSVKNNYPFNIYAEVIDEMPAQFQVRNYKWQQQFKPGEEKVVKYTLRPVERGEYHFGNIIILVRSMLGFLSRKFEVKAEQMIPVYPSFIQMRKYELIAETAQNNEMGNKRLRRIGHSLEFEKIKEYIRGDDIRTINWKASARRGMLMVNTFTDERSQQVFCLIDKGRLMKMPFEGLSLLDYAINASLVLCNVSLHKQDRFGLLTFSNKTGTILPADRKPTQLENVLQVLYNQKTDFLETDFELLYARVRAHIKHRSLLVLFTNFESIAGLQRQLPYLVKLSRYHLLLVVFFENTEIKQLTEKRAADLEGVYIKTIAEKFAYEKRLIVKELQKHGILSILTTPQNVTVDTINKYLELKTRQAI